MCAKPYSLQWMWNADFGDGTCPLVPSIDVVYISGTVATEGIVYLNLILFLFILLQVYFIESLFRS